MQRTILPALLLLMACREPRPVATVPADRPMPEAGNTSRERVSAWNTDAVVWQHTSAEAHRLFLQGFELARIRLADNLVRTDERPAAVVVDIDETVLDNSPYQVHIVNEGTTYDQASWKAWTDRSQARAMPGAVEFLLHAQRSGCEVFYITNRDIRERASTLRNLDSLGFPFADDRHLMLMDGSSDKTERRASVSATHRIVLLIGDQLRDFDERFKDRSDDYGKGVVEEMADTLQRYFILLPNPMYGTYRDPVQGKGSDAEKEERTRSWFKSNAY
ncbi:MAG: 5'-nucleotidase, lipoprotein e(P4) family [Flavobacteriales bacterium]